MTHAQQHRPEKRDGSTSPVGPFEAISRKPNGHLHRTRHHSLATARKRLAGNSRHEDGEVIDHSPPAPPPN